jgi:putative toxin-antitoxin system antitoxin component (TIGR02293 family)
MSATIKGRLTSLEELGELSDAGQIEAVTQGLPVELARELGAKLEIPQETLAALLHLTPRTLQRRFETDTLGLAESERICELSRVFSRASEVLESDAAAVQWLKSPVQALGWKKPLDLAHTLIGLRQVEAILGRIEHGVFS